MSAGGDDRDFLHGRQGRIACQASFVLVHLLRPDLLDPGGMRPTTTHGARGLRPGHGAANPRDAGDAMALSRPTDGMFRTGPAPGAIRLPSIRLGCGDRPSDQIGTHLALEHGRQVDRLHDVAIERIHVHTTALEGAHLGLRLLRLRGLRCLRALRALLRFGGLLAPDSCRPARLGRCIRGRFLLRLRHERHTPCFDSRET